MHGPYAGVRSIAKNAAIVAIAQAVGILARTIYIVLVARLLGPELYAVLAWSQSWYLAFLPLALFGLGALVVNAISADRARAPAIAAEALAIRLLMTAVAAATCIVLGWFAAPDARASALISILVLALIGRAVTAWAQHIYTAFEVPYHTLRQEMLFRVIELAAAVAILVSGGGLLLLVTSHALVWWAQAARALYVVRRELLPVRVAWRPAEWQPLAALAMPFFIIAMATEWRVQGPLVLFRSVAGGDVPFGQFALAMQPLALVSVLPVALGTAAQPALTRSALRGDGKDLIYARTIQRFALVIGTVAGLAGLAFGAPLFRLVFGERFLPAGELVGLTLWCLVPMLAGFAFPPVLVARGRFRVQMLASVAGAVAMTVLVPALGASAGAPGAILAVGIGYALTPLIAWLYAARQGWTGPLSAMLRPAGAMAAALATWLTLAPVSPWLALPAALLVLAAASALLGVVTREERAFLRSFWRERRRSA